MEGLDLEQVRQHYVTLKTEELIRLYNDNEVSDQALPTLLDELRSRGVDISKLSRASKEEVDTRLLKRQNKRALAAVVCGGIFFAYHFIGVAVFDWPVGYSGGLIPILILLGGLAALWRTMTK